ncbi:MAG: ribose 5-phosphate isomerase B [Lachnospiraceae bacterium]|jgi:ribose 5-phosphate isomerase B|nr:ribose 5-phosphate isomerase B [Lachnospiraceae bacterium]
MKIGFGCDHTAVELKLALMDHLREQGHECVDYGTKEAGVRMDYPVVGKRVAEAVAGGEVEKGVLVCGTGVGISLSANKVPGIRAAVCSEPYTACMTVRHNNANILAMGARVVGTELAKMIADAFFQAEYEGGRHEVRVKMLADIEQEYCMGAHGPLN